MTDDPTTFREDVLIHAVDYAEVNGTRMFHAFEAVITRAKSDPMRTRNALEYWCRFVREGATKPVLMAYGGDPSKGSYAINDESQRMRDQIARDRRQGGTQIGTVHGPVHTGAGNLNVNGEGTLGGSKGGPGALERRVLVYGPRAPHSGQHECQP